MNSKNNGYFFSDVPFEMFLKYTIPFDVCDRYNIPYETQWYEISQQLAEQIINDILANTNDSILAMHLVFKKNFDHGRVFDLYELVDNYPSPEGFWITQALQFYKSAFVKEYKMSKVYRENDHRIQVIKDHYDKHKWYPSYWGWIVEGPVDDQLEDVEYFIEKYGTNAKWQNKLDQLFYTGREYIIRGDKFVLDKDGNIYKDFCNTLNIKPKQDVLDNIYNYASGNENVFKQLGLFNKINNPMNTKQQVDLLKQTFLPIYKQLVERDI